ncbi:MAG: efflux RND transporter permease subunit [Bacteroidales bacterium]|nr:efflux RND transporter permease subunit [Bacteroidales bacterium]
MNLSSWGLSHQRLVLLLIVILTLGGVRAFFRMPKLEDPEIEVRQAVVVGIYPGASAHQIELELTGPLENSIRKTDHILFTQSYSYADMCYILVTQDVSVPSEELQDNWMIMRNHLAATSLPAGSQLIVRDDFGQMSGLFYALKGEGVEPERLSAFAEMIRRELQKLDGVSHVDIYGTPQKRVNIALRQDLLSSMDITPAEVMATLSGQGATTYAGYFLSGDYRIRVGVDNRFRSVEDIRSLLLKGHEGEMFRLEDIADVTLEEERTVREEFRRDGERVLGLLISAKSGTDIVKVGASVEKTIERLQATRMPASVSCEKVFFQSDRVKDAMGSFLLNLIGSLLLVIVLLMITMNFRSGIILGITLVVTVLGTVLFLDMTDGALQRVSLGSFILAMGMLVDNAIVIVDGILVGRQKGLSRWEALTSIGQKTAIPLLGATLIAILAFLPIFLSPDVTGLYVRDMFIVLAVSLLLSWLLALVLVPILGDRWLYSQPLVPAQPQSSRPHQWLSKALEYALSNRWRAVGAMVGLLAIAGLSFSLMPRELFPDMEYDQLYMEYKLPEGTHPSRVKADLDSIGRELMAFPGVKHVTTSIGATPGRYNLVRSVALPSLSYGELIVDFESVHALDRSIDSLQRHFSAKYPDAFLKFKPYNLMFMRYPIELTFCGPDPAVLHQLADSAMIVARSLGCIDPLTTDWAPRVPVLMADYDQARGRQQGISRMEVALSLLSATDGMPLGSYYDGAVNHNIYVSTTDQQGAPLSDLGNATVSSLLPNLEGAWENADWAGLLSGASSLRLSQTVPLREVAGDMNLQWEDPVIPHYNGERSHSVMGHASKGYLTEEARARLASEVEQWELPDGYSIQWGGEKYATNLSISNLLRSYPLVILLMLAILLAITRRFRISILLLLSVPFIFVGIVPAILLTGSTFNFVAIVGTLGLVGMMLKNGIVLVDEIGLQREAGADLKQAIMDASLSRLRPVMLASLTTVLGMVPLLFDDMFSSLAATIMGGLLVGTVIVLVFIPVLYSLFFSKQAD